MTPERFASGRTFDQYLEYLASADNLAREANAGARPNRADFFRQAFAERLLTADQEAALQWLVAQPGGPARMLVVSEDWSSDCRRDVPTFARIAALTGMELRIFDRDGAHFGEPADMIGEFVNHKNGGAFHSIPVCAFYDQAMQPLYTFTEYPAIYDKDRVVQQNIRAARPGESADETRERSEREFAALVASPFFRIWTTATVDEIVSALHRKAVLGVT